MKIYFRIFIVLIFLVLSPAQASAQTHRRHYIPWYFYIYAESNFESARLGSFEPQFVEVLNTFNNWAIISTDIGEHWVYLAAERRYIEPSVSDIESFMAQFGNTVSVFYENLETGFVFSHHGDRVFFGASATKAPFALYIYQKAERGETNLNSVHTYIAADYWGGSGFIRRRYSVGATFTQRELLFLMLSPSDNIATRMLRRIHGVDSYRDFIADIGGNPHFVQNITYSYLSANEAGFIMKEIFKYITSDGRYSHEFKDNLLQNRYPFIISDYPVASKSGWAYNFGGAYHDMAIVFAPSPYTLSILSTRPGRPSDRAAFEAISMFFQEFNNQWFVGEGR